MTKFLENLDDNLPFKVNVLDAIILLWAAWGDVPATTIRNCFHHCGLSSTDEPIVPTEEEEEREDQEQEGENTSSEDNLIDRLSELVLGSTPTPVEVMEEWVDCDNDISTVGNLTDAEIIQLAQSANCNDEDEDDTVIQKPSVTEVRKALKCLQDFSLCSQLQDGVLDAITALENQ